MAGFSLSGGRNSPFARHPKKGTEIGKTLFGAVRQQAMAGVPPVESAQMIGSRRHTRHAAGRRNAPQNSKEKCIRTGWQPAGSPSSAQPIPSARSYPSTQPVPSSIDSARRGWRAKFAACPSSKRSSASSTPSQLVGRSPHLAQDLQVFRWQANRRMIPISPAKPALVHSAKYLQSFRNCRLTCAGFQRRT